MSKIKAIIIDDEAASRDRLLHLLLPYSAKLEVIGTFENVESGYNGILKLKPDIIFLDVHLHEQTGFDLLRKFNTINFEIVFTTAHDNYAIEAFKFSAMDYLLKPVDREELKTTIEKLEKQIGLNAMGSKFETLLQNIAHENKADKVIAIPTMQGLTFLPVKDIIRCHSDQNYTHIHTQNKETLLASKSLKQFEELLTDYNFFRIHHSSLINMSYIKKYNKGKGGSLTMHDGSEIEVSVRRKEVFLKKLAEAQLLF